MAFLSGEKQERRLRRLEKAQQSADLPRMEAILATELSVYRESRVIALSPGYPLYWGDSWKAK